MADATVTASVVPSGSAQDIDDIVTDLLAEGLDAVVADPGNDLVVSADITHSVGSDTDGTDGIAEIEAAITAVGDCELVGPIRVVADPVVSAPSNVSIDISDENTVVVQWEASVSQNASLASVAVESADLDGVNVPYAIIHGDPSGHDSQKSSAGIVRVLVGPAPAGAATGSPHDLVITVEDSDGREASDTVQVAVTA
jgi:hypothetical protein